MTERSRSATPTPHRRDRRGLGRHPARAVPGVPRLLGRPAARAVRRLLARRAPSARSPRRSRPLADARGGRARSTTSTASPRPTSPRELRLAHRAARGRFPPARPQRHRLARAGAARHLRPHADRDRRRLGEHRQAPRAPARRDRRLHRDPAQGIAAGIVPAVRQVREVLTQARKQVADNGFFSEFAGDAKPARRRRCPPPRADLADGAGRRPRPTPSSPTFLEHELAPARREKDAVGRELYALRLARLPRRRRSTSTRPTSGASRSSPAWSPSRSRSPNEILPGASVARGHRAPRRRPGRKLHGTDALQRWMQETSDRAIAELGATHFDIPDRDPPPRVHDRADPGGRHLLHRPDRRLLPRPAACGGPCPRASPSSTPGASSPPSTTRACPAITCRSAQAVYNRAQLNTWRRSSPALRPRRGLGALRRAPDGAARLPRRPGRPAGHARRPAHARGARRARHRRAPRQAAARRQGPVDRRLRARLHARAT